MTELLDVDAFVAAERDGALVRISDNSSGLKLHRLPCQYVRLEHFKEKVIVKQCKNGRYHRVDENEVDTVLGYARPCPLCESRIVRLRRPNDTPVARSGGNAVVRDGHRAQASATRGQSTRVLRLAPPRIGFEAQCAAQLDLGSKPPDPRGELRNLVREAIRGMPASDGRLLRAVYRAPSLLRGSDVENVLFTNVDATGSVFGRLASAGLEFEFVARVPASGELPCSSTYELVESDHRSARWGSAQQVASWARVPIPDPRMISRAPALWWHIRRAEAELHSATSVVGPFGIELVVHAPAGASLNLAQKIKLFADAVVLGFACDNGRTEESGLAAMSNYAGAPLEALRELLLEQSRAVLGSHRLVDRRGQVSPPDDRCELGLIRIQPSVDSAWLLSGRLLELV